MLRDIYLKKNLIKSYYKELELRVALGLFYSAISHSGCSFSLSPLLKVPSQAAMRCCQLGSTFVSWLHDDFGKGERNQCSTAGFLRAARASHIWLVVHEILEASVLFGLCTNWINNSNTGSTFMVKSYYISANYLLSGSSRKEGKICSLSNLYWNSVLPTYWWCITSCY